MLFRYHNSSRLCPRCHGHIHLCLRHSIEYGYIGIQFGPVAAGIYYCMQNGYLVFIAYGSIVAAHSASELVKKVCCIFVVDKEVVHMIFIDHNMLCFKVGGDRWLSYFILQHYCFQLFAVLVDLRRHIILLRRCVAQHGLQQLLIFKVAVHLHRHRLTHTQHGEDEAYSADQHYRCKYGVHFFLRLADIGKKVSGNKNQHTDPYRCKP